MDNPNLKSKESTKENYNYIILKKFFDEFGSQDIINEFNQVIGKINFNLFKLNRNLEIQDLRSNKLITIEIKNTLFSTNLLSKYENGDIFGKIKISKLLLPRSIIYIMNKNGDKQYSAIGDLKRWNYKIMNLSNDEIIAKIRDVNEKNTLIQNLHIVFGKYYCIEFINQTIEKIKIMCFIITLNFLMNKVNKISDIAGIERRIARLRPFGPGKSLN